MTTNTEDGSKIFKAKTMMLTKFDEFCKSVKPVYDFKSGEPGKVIVTGGCLSSIFHDEPVNDYDFYLTDRDVAMKLVDFYKNDGNSRVTDWNSNYSGITKNAITLKNPEKVQIIIKDDFVLPEAMDIINTFDFLHVKWWFDPDKNNLWITPNVLKAIRDKTLIVVGPNGATEERMDKFFKRGWKLG